MPVKPQRTCLGCREAIDQDALVRFVLSPQGDLLVDYRRRLPGRGAYTHPARQCILNAVKRQQFGRTLRQPGLQSSAPALLDSLAGQIRERVAGLLGMARKSGQIISGSNAVLEALANPGRVGLVLVAEDISPAIEEKVRARAAAASVACHRLLEKGHMGQILGKAERSVAAVPGGPLSEAIRIELSRYTDIAGES